ncbi:9900_t:CDS:2 [Ambispora leptoticha]|uniref:9900_t:CDS:1 n=1 Tax=Ambispora leptoticha TaxID=144679 RepID=A0A9N9ATA7_9GLOM|nr:9900_t:CDS:2 [Ambispora leptoticha]
MDVNFGFCRDCKKRNTSLRWCQSCNSKRLEADFPNWTSGNKKIDEFLRETQLTARCWQEVFEWIPYSNIIEVELVGKGGYGTVYKAKWKGGCIIKWMRKEKTWKRWGTEFVALKSLYGDFNEFMHELKTLHRCTRFNPNGFECYGVTQDPITHNYMIVADFYGKGDLRQYFHYGSDKLDWSKKLDMLKQIASDLHNIHKANLVHRDLHSGNVLIDSITCIADLGLSRDENISQTFTEVSGVLPYVAPEVLHQQPYTKAADVYSFGMIMWEFTSYRLPFSERSHDIYLALDICKGLRPDPIEGTPPCYVKLMQQCWDSDPNKRPTAEYIAETLQSWFEGSDENIQNQFKTADEVDSMRERPSQVCEIHPSAVYTSRCLPTIPLGDFTF